MLPWLVFRHKLARPGACGEPKKALHAGRKPDILPPAGLGRAPRVFRNSRNRFEEDFRRLEDIPKTNDQRRS
jgi:hypothetical protein